MIGDYEIASKEIVNMANEIIEKYHPELKDEKIAYVIRYSTWTKNGKQVFGTAKKCSDKEKLLTGYSFIITLSNLVLNMSQDTIKAVIDHELSHCGVEEDEYGEKKRYIIEHDLEDFAHIIKRYGLYSDDAKHFMEQTKQISFFDDDKNLMKFLDNKFKDGNNDMPA